MRPPGIGKITVKKKTVFLDFRSSIFGFETRLFPMCLEAGEADFVISELLGIGRISLGIPFEIGCYRFAIFSHLPDPQWL